LTLQQLMALGFWDVLKLAPGASKKAIRQKYQELALVYHPDKGGDSVVFSYIKLVYETLYDTKAQKLYDLNGKSYFTSGFSDGAAPPSGSHTVPKPGVNKIFMKELLAMEGAWNVHIGKFTLATYLQKAMASSGSVDVYHENNLAVTLGLALRLTGRGDLPVYCQPRLVRWAAFLGQNLIELDFPASHGQQLYKYAVRHGLPHDTLKAAFGDTVAIQKFRADPSHGVSPGDVKTATNMLAYGNALVEWSRSLVLTKLPPLLKLLKGEIEQVRSHMKRHCPEPWKQVLMARGERWVLTLCSVHCQLGERADLDTVRNCLPVGVTVHGWLGDSMLVTPVDGFDPQSVCEAMASQGISITVKPFPQTPTEYFEAVRDLKVEFDTSPVSQRRARRTQALDYCMQWMAAAADPLVYAGPMPHLDFAIAIEEILPCYFNPLSGNTEYYSEDDGVWYPSGGQMVLKGEVLSDALLHTFAPKSWCYEDETNMRRRRLRAGDCKMFHTAPVLGSIGEMCKHLRFRTDLAMLDSGANVSKLVNFKGPTTLDFSIQRPVVDWTDDEQLTAALNLPVRPSKMTDRTQRSVPRAFEEYEHKTRLQYAQAIHGAMLELQTADTLSEDAKQKLAVVALDHPMLLHCFFEAHLDWDSAIMQARLLLEPCSNTGTRCQIATFKDGGGGSTAKGTVRELAEQCLGCNNGDTQRGYVAVLSQETLQVRDSEGPSEQKSNLFLTKHAWVDDFKPTKPISTAVLRQISGGNNITQARKHAKEFTFKFDGQTILACNGIWCPDVPFVGADIRRVTGLNFEVNFVDEASGPNEMLKDAALKANLSNYFAEWWFLVRVLWLTPQPRPKADCTEPKCPNTIALVAEFVNNGDFEVAPEMVESFVTEKLSVYTLSEQKPSSCQEIVVAFHRHVCKEIPSVDEKTARIALRKVLNYKSGVTLARSGARKKTSVNAFVDDTGAFLTLNAAHGMAMLFDGQ